MTDITKHTEGFGALTLEKSAELAAIAIAAAAKAEVEARHIMAMKNPRDEEAARIRILRACDNPTFAKKARFRKPVGGSNFVVGPSIRFAEEMIRSWRNVLAQAMVIYDDATKRVVKIIVGDLEANVAYSRELMLEKSVERKSSKDRDVLSERKNSYNETVYIVRATEDELLIKQEANSSKVIRNNALRLIPQHIIDEAMERVAKTLMNKAAEDPDAERRELLDGFAARGVMPLDLTEYIGAPVAQWTPEQFVKLRETLAYLEENSVSWRTFLEGTPADETQEVKGKSQPDTLGQQIVKQATERQGNELSLPETQGQGKATEAQEEQKPKDVKATSEINEHELGLLRGYCKEAEDELLKTTEGRAAYQIVWRNFQLPDIDFAKKPGATLLWGDKVPAYLSQLKHAVKNQRPRRTR